MINALETGRLLTGERMRRLVKQHGYLFGWYTTQPIPTEPIFVTQLTKGMGAYRHHSDFQNEPPYDVNFGTNGKGLVTRMPHEKLMPFNDLKTTDVEKGEK